MLSHRMYALLVISCESQNIYHRVLSVKNFSEIDFNMYHTWHSQFSFSFLRNERKITSKIKCYRTVLVYYQCCKQRIPFLTIGWISLKRIFKHIIRANFQSTRKKKRRETWRRQNYFYSLECLGMQLNRNKKVFVYLEKISRVLQYECAQCSLIHILVVFVAIQKRR